MGTFIIMYFYGKRRKRQKAMILFPKNSMKFQQRQTSSGVLSPSALVFHMFKQSSSSSSSLPLPLPSSSFSALPLPLPLPSSSCIPPTSLRLLHSSKRAAVYPLISLFSLKNKTTKSHFHSQIPKNGNLNDDSLREMILKAAQMPQNPVSLRQMVEFG
jgi:hypothetical protein